MKYLIIILIFFSCSNNSNNNNSISNKVINYTIDINREITSLLSYDQVNFNNINKRNLGFTIFANYINDLDIIRWEFIKYIIKNGGDWNLEQGGNLISSEKKGTTPFAMLLNQKNIKLYMIKYAVKTGAKWTPKGWSNPFVNLINNPDLTPKMIKYAIKTGAKWYKTDEYTYLELLIEREVKGLKLTFNMVKAAIESGAKIKDISELRISFITNKKIKNYLMKLKKESK